MATFPALEAEAAEIQRLLAGRTLHRVWRHRPTEIVLEFADGARLFVDRTSEGLDFSITLKDDEDEKSPA